MHLNDARPAACGVLLQCAVAVNRLMSVGSRRTALDSNDTEPSINPVLSLSR